MRTKNITIILASLFLATHIHSEIIFSPNDDGVKDSAVFRLNIKTPKEDIKSWEFSILNLKNKKIKVFSDQGAPPAKIVWDGRDENNILVTADKYKYSFFAISKAGTKEKIKPQPIVIDYEKPKVSVSANLAMFSPNKDGVKDEVLFSMKSSDKNGMNSWLFIIEDNKGGIIKSYSGPGEVKPTFIWDGTDTFGNQSADGDYYYYLVVQDNGGNRSQTKPKTVHLSRAAMVSKIKAEPKIISPNNDGNHDELNVFIEETGNAEVESWQLMVLNVVGKPVKMFEGKGYPNRRIIWDGLNNQGDIVNDGNFSLVLSETDKAGNTILTPPVNFTVDNSPPLVVLGLTNQILSPNGDGISDTTKFNFKISDVHSFDWKFYIKNDMGKIVKTESGTSKKVDKEITWTGLRSKNKKVDDGIYTYYIETKDIAENFYKSPPSTLQVDGKPPVIKAKASPKLFSPNDDGVLDKTQFDFQITDASPIERWEIKVQDDLSKVVKTFKGHGRTSNNIAWNGRDENRAVLQDGSYSWTIFAKDIVGNSAVSAPQKVVIGAAKPAVYASANHPIFSPNADRIKDQVTFDLKAKSFSKVTEWTFEIEQIATVRTFSGFGPPPKSINWYGDNDEKKPLKDGKYTYVFSVTDSAGNRASSLRKQVLIDTEKPGIQVNADAAVFSPNGDKFRDGVNLNLQYTDKSQAAEWKIIIEKNGGKKCKVFSGENALPVSVFWAGDSDDKENLADGIYNYYLSATDIVGNKSITYPKRIRIDNTPPQAEIAASALLFSPNGDGKKDTVTFFLGFKDESNISDWAIEAVGPDDARKKYEGIGRPPAKIKWDGRNGNGHPLPDGIYKTSLTIKDEVENIGKSAVILVEIDNTKPIVSITAEDQPIEKLQVNSFYTETDAGIVVSLSSEVLFFTGKADIKKEAIQALIKVTNLIRRYPERKILIEGHTDNVPISTPQFPNNMVLSEARAMSVRDYLVNIASLAANRFIIKKYGATKPVATNKTSNGRQKNRRVEITLLKHSRGAK